MEKMRQWSLLTAVAVVAMLAGGWFLLVSPQRSHAASYRSQATTQQQENASLQSQISQLLQQKNGLPAQQRLLDSMAQKVPSTPDLPALIRQLSAAADSAGVDLVSLAPSTPTMVTTTAGATAPVAPPATGTTSSTSTTSAAAPTTGTSGPPLARIPLVITVQGNYYSIISFMRAVEKLPRAVFVPQFTLAPNGGSSSGGSASANSSSGGGSTSPTGKTVPANYLLATITGSVFESPDTVAAPTTLTPAAPAAAAQ